MRTIRLLFYIVFAILFFACKENEDYRDKWCGKYNFKHYKITQNYDGICSDTTIFSTGNIYYTNEIEKDEIIIKGLFPTVDNKVCVKVNMDGEFISLDINPLLNNAEGYFVGNDSLYYHFYGNGGHAYFFNHFFSGKKNED